MKSINFYELNPSDGYHHTGFSQSAMIYSSVESFSTTYRIVLSGFGNDEFHLSEFHHTDP